MSEYATIGVLRDVFILGILALGLALAIYASIRSCCEEHQWHADGNVLSRPYNGMDGAVAFVLLLPFLWAIIQTSGPADGVDPVKSTDNLSLTALVVNAVFLLSIGIAIMLYLRLFRGLNPAEMFGLRQLSVRQALVQALVWIFVTYIIMQVTTFILYHYVLNGDMLEDGAQETVTAFKNAKSPVYKFLLGFTAVVVAPLTEETIFRGLVYGVTKRFTDRWFAAFFSACMFAVVHQHVGSTFPLFVLAIGLAVAYETTGSLLVPVFMHALFNGWNVAILSVS